MLESIKKLRKKLEEDTAGDFVFTTCPEQHGFRAGATIENYEAIADEIEREVAERYVELPKDADGEYIHIGDEVDGDHYEDGTVAGIQFYEMANGGIRTLIAVRPDGWDVATWHTPDEYRRHHKPTVEDVLREMVAAYMDTPLDDSNDGEFFAEYAAKLRLAGDGE